MAQLVAIVVVIVLVSVAGAWLERGGPVACVVGRLQLAAGGFATGFLLSLILELMLWPGAIGAIFGIYTPPSPEQDRWAGIVFAVIVGGAGAIVPNLAFRVGYAGAVLLGVQHSSAYWLGDDRGWLLLLGLGCWTFVAIGVRAIRWWLRPDPRVERASEPPDSGTGAAGATSRGTGPRDSPASRRLTGLLRSRRVRHFATLHVARLP
jgi:hypothetical protein